METHELDNCCLQSGISSNGGHVLALESLYNSRLKKCIMIVTSPEHDCYRPVHIFIFLYGEEAP